MADATKVPPVGEFSYRNNSWVDGSYPNHCIDADHYDQEKVVTNEMATEIKVVLVSLQEYTDRICPFKIISACPQSTNESCDEYNYNIMNTVLGLDNVHCIPISFDGLSTETKLI